MLDGAPVAVRAWRPYLAVALLLGALALGVGSLAWRRQTDVAAAERQRAAALALGPRLRVVPVVAGDGKRIIVLPGDVHPLREVTLYAKVSGYLRELRVDKGDRVRANQVLALLASPETDEQLRSSAVNEAAKAQVQSRYRSLVDRGVVSKLDMDRVNADANLAQAELHRQHALVDYETLRAPFAGIVSARYVDAGALVSAGTGSTQSAQPILELVDASSVRVYIYVSQAEAPFVHVGDVVQLSSPEDARVDRAAQVTRVSGALDPRSRTMLVEVDVANPDGSLLPGIFVRVALTVQGAPAPAIPAEAVFLRHGVPYAAVVKDGHVQLRRIELAGNLGASLRVRHGLAVGEQVALYAGDIVEDGAPVQAVTAP